MRFQCFSTFSTRYHQNLNKTSFPETNLHPWENNFIEHDDWKQLQDVRKFKWSPWTEILLDLVSRNDNSICTASLPSTAHLTREADVLQKANILVLNSLLSINYQAISLINETGTWEDDEGGGRSPLRESADDVGPMRRATSARPGVSDSSFDGHTASLGRSQISPRRNCECYLARPRSLVVNRRGNLRSACAREPAETKRARSR